MVPLTSGSDIPPYDNKRLLSQPGFPACIRRFLEPVDNPVRPHAMSNLCVGARLSPFLIASANSVCNCPMLNGSPTNWIKPSAFHIKFPVGV